MVYRHCKECERRFEVLSSASFPDTASYEAHLAEYKEFCRVVERENASNL